MVKKRIRIVTDNGKVITGTMEEIHEIPPEVREERVGPYKSYITAIAEHLKKKHSKD